MTKIMTILGTRPEAIKLAPVIKTLDRYGGEFISTVCITSQHRHMVSQVLEFFGIKPQYDLNVMTQGHSLGQITTRVLVKVGRVLSEEKPHLVLVQGDTTTSFAASLAAFYQKIRVGHVEAGLRTLDRYEPYPEEMNRRLVSALADYHFAPTAGAKVNLIIEGVAAQNVIVTGNTGIDSLFMTLERIKQSGERSRWCDRVFKHLRGKRLVLVTAHRRENFGMAFEEICRALIEISERNHDVVVIYPVHLNPNIRGPARRLLRGHERIILVPPVPYPAFVDLLARAYLILTDSGGIQEEAPSLGKPVLVMRNVTERPEAIEVGTARLVGTQAETIVRETQKLLVDRGEYERMCKVKNPFGDGMASERIIEYILKSVS